MKTKLTFTSLLTKLLFATFFLTLCTELTAQNQGSSNMKDFKITLEKTDNGLKLQSLKGSAWINLSFSLPNDKPQTIDEYGMTTLDKVSTNIDASLADYLFTVTKTKDGIKLIGLAGTAWKELSFTLPQNGQQTIDQFGMSK
ncbi:MAG: hypothetical protein EOO43_14755 [Flavobacterium sp.]|nr:MAG: hypothetical protein EOO43_14755 [Flavobacterium sp.]